MQVSIVLGAGFGDEGKGKTVSYLTSKSKKPLIIRFSGGHQAGHTVVIGKERHIFSHFGSGTLQGAGTFWSKYCTVYLIGLVNEYNALLKLGSTPKLQIDDLCPITTPYDVFANRYFDKINNHGTCGVGIGTTLERHELYKLYFRDIFYTPVFRSKLDNIRQYWISRGVEYSVDDLIKLYENVHKYFEYINFIKNEKIGRNYKFEGRDTDHIIFEGSQGILLDQDFGFFPNVTRSYTTARNALEILNELSYYNFDIKIFYVSRVYQTRHGNGFMSDERFLDLTNNKDETNIENKYQGKFRKGLLDTDLIKYAIECNDTSKYNENLVFTCIDQLGNEIETVNHGKVNLCQLKSLIKPGISSVLYSYGSETEKMTDDLWKIKNLI